MKPYKGVKTYKKTFAVMFKKSLRINHIQKEVSYVTKTKRQ